MKSVKRLAFSCSLAAAAFAITLPSGCSKESSAAHADEAKPITTFFPIKIGDRTPNLQIAVTSQEMEVGLMNRRDLKPDDGMVFVFPQPTRMSFWMRNTPTALDIGYFSADGVLREIYPMYPLDETTVQSRSSQLQFAIEMNQGWYARNGVKPGAQLDMKALVAAVKARGFKPKAVGLGAYDQPGE